MLGISVENLNVDIGKQKKCLRLKLAAYEGVR